MGPSLPAPVQDRVSENRRRSNQENDGDLAQIGMDFLLWGAPQKTD